MPGLSIWRRMSSGSLPVKVAVGSFSSWRRIGAI
jgi:predicted DNA-binding transcriptional regulator AlpA